MAEVNAQAQASLAQVHNALREDHRRIEELAGRLKDAPDLSSLLSSLRELYAALLTHFSHEEHPNGLYDALGVCVPEHRETLSQLVEDHHRMGATLWNLTRGLHDHVDRSYGEVREEALRLLSLLEDHESREHHLAETVLARKATA
jgi:hypothetical protein